MLNEKDELNYLYNEKEYIVRKHIWDVMYKDWLDEQKEKKMYEKPMQLEPKKIRSRKVIFFVFLFGRIIFHAKIRKR